MISPRNLIISVLAIPLMNASATLLVVDPSATGKETYPTIQAAVDAAKPGDTVQIRGGVYYEHVHIKKGGEPGRPLTMEAAPNELVVINAGKKLEVALKSAAGLPEVFVADVPADLITEKVGFWEAPTRLRLAPVQTPAQTAQRLGSWFYDAIGRKLYLRSSGHAPANQLAYWIESSDTPAVQVTASHVRLRNLQVTLGENGIVIKGKTSHVSVENCRAFCNSWAGIHVTGNHHLIRHNETFQNNTYGIQLRFGVNNVRVLNNLCYFNGPDNGEATGSSVPTDLGIYSQGGFNLFEGNIVEGMHEDVYRNKTGHGANPTNVLRNNVIKGNQTPGPYGVYNNTLIVSGLGMRGGMYRNGGDPSPLRDWKYVDPSGLQRASNLIWPLVQKEDPRFADISYRDYRLQADSPCLGSGAYPGLSQIFYIDPKNGSDDNLGLSLAKPLATLPAALERLSAGATLYLLPGDYAEPAVLVNGGLDVNHPLQIRAYNKNAGVRLGGGLRIENSQFVEFEGIEFVGLLELEKSEGVRARHCVFAGQKAGIRAKESSGLQVDHCTFVDNAESVALAASPGASITQSLFIGKGLSLNTDAAGADSVFLAFNAFTNFKARMGDKQIDGLKNAPNGGSRNSFETEIKLGADYILPNGGALAMSGADFGYLGARTEDAASQLEITNLRVAGLGPEGATLLWDTPRKATFAEITLKDKSGKIIRTWEPSFLIQIMGTFFDVTKFTQAFFSSQRHAGVSGLQPGTAYTAAVVAMDIAGNRSKPFEVDFKTPANLAAPATYYVSPEGKDTADGKTPDTPWGTFAHALTHVGPGDEVVLLPGEYREILRPQISGTKDHKIKIRAAKPLEAVIDLAESLPVAVELVNVDHIEISGLLIRNGDFPRSQCYQLNRAEGITIRDCEIAYPRGSTLEKLKLGYSGLIASGSPGLTVENNLFLCSVVGVAASSSPGTVIRHNTFVGEGNYGVVLVPGSAEETYTIEDNLFYRAVMGYKTGPCIWVFEPMPRLTCDNNLFFIPENHKGTIGKLPHTERLFPLDVWVKETGFDKKSFQAEPHFVDPENRDFTLKAGSPGKGQASDGTDIGRVR